MADSVGGTPPVLILLTNSAYSDYNVDGLFEVPAYEWCDAKLAEFLGLHPQMLANGKWEAYTFAEWLKSHPEVRPVKFREAWCSWTMDGAPKTLFGDGLYDQDGKDLE